MSATDKDFSWMEIHKEGTGYSLWLYNKNGLIKMLYKSRSLECVQDSMKRRQALRERIQKVLVEAVKQALSDPEVMKRLKKE